MLHAILGTLSTLVALASCNSLGLNVPICSADDPRIWRPLPKGCTKEMALGGHSCASGYAMWWAFAPKHTSKFQTYASSSPGRETKMATYRPSSLTYIHVRATEQDFKYRGLLLYAEDKLGNKIGSWELPPEAGAMFHTPPGSCEGKAVMHSGADLKNYHHVFAFRSPPAGTGKLTFKCLLKTGEANTGAFHWANSAGPLTLNERSGGSQPPSWIKANPGQSCTEACKAVGGTCDSGKFKAVKSQNTFLNAIASDVACKLPVLGGCARTDPSQSADEGLCQFHESSCKKTPSCSQLDESSRLCPCKGIRTRSPSPQKCDSYCSKKSPCKWTKKYSCPWSSKKGIKGKAANDGETAYHCCCEANTKYMGCGGSSKQILDEDDEDTWLELAQMESKQPVCDTITDPNACKAANCVAYAEDGMSICEVSQDQLRAASQD